jgi:hypothetical protein
VEICVVMVTCVISRVTTDVGPGTSIVGPGISTVGPGISIVGPGIVRVLVKDDTIVVVRTTSIGTSVVMVDVTVVPDSAIMLVRCTKIPVCDGTYQ